MRIGFTGKSVNLDDRQRDYAEKKLQKLARHFSSAREAQITHRVQRNLHSVEVQVDLDGTLLRAEARHGDVLTAIDQVSDKLEEQVRRLKSKVKNHKGRADAPTVAAVLAEGTEEAGTPAEQETLPTVVRRKRFSVRPMSPDEASLQMELLNHDFFAFLNAETDQPAILYRRRDGDYGLLELEV